MSCLITHKDIKTIAIDIDDTVINLLDAWLTYLNNRHNTKVKREDITEWEIANAFPELSKEQVFSPLYEKDFWESVVPLPYSYQYLKKLYDDGYIVKFVTAASYDTIKYRLENVIFTYYNFIKEKDIIICQDKQYIDCDVLIDDNVDNLKNFKGIRFLIDAPYNKSDKYRDCYDMRVKNLKDVYQILQLSQLHKRNNLDNMTAKRVRSRLNPDVYDISGSGLSSCTVGHYSVHKCNL